MGLRLYKLMQPLTTVVLIFLRFEILHSESRETSCCKGDELLFMVIALLHQLSTVVD